MLLRSPLYFGWSHSLWCSRTLTDPQCIQIFIWRFLYKFTELIVMKKMFPLCKTSCFINNLWVAYNYMLLPVFSTSVLTWPSFLHSLPLAFLHTVNIFPDLHHLLTHMFLVFPDDVSEPAGSIFVPGRYVILASCCGAVDFLFPIFEPADKSYFFILFCFSETLKHPP